MTAVSAQEAPVRTSARQAEKVAQIAAQRRAWRVLDSNHNTMTPTDERTVTQILGSLEHDLTACAGGCGLRLLKYAEWQKVGKGERGRLRELGVNRVSSYGRCWKCAEIGAPVSKRCRKYFGQKVSAETRDQIPEIWKEIQENGGGTPELGRRLGVTRERARQLVKELGLPHRDRRGARTKEFLEELHHLAGFGLGAHEIAQKLGTNADALVQQIDKLRARGLTTVSFPNYFEFEDAA